MKTPEKVRSDSTPKRGRTPASKPRVTASSAESGLPVKTGIRSGVSVKKKST